MKKIFHIFLALLIVSTAFILLSCDDESTDNGTLQVKLIDAPITLTNGEVVEEVNMTITRVDVVKKGSEEADEPETDERSGTNDEIKDGKGVTTVFEGEKSFNLLDYNEETQLDIGEVELEAADYLQLRFVIKEDACTIKFQGDDTQYPLTIPSGTSSGLKIKGNGNNPLFTIADGDEAELIFDLDAMESIEVSTNKQGYKMRPVIKKVKFNNQEREYTQD